MDLKGFKLAYSFCCYKRYVPVQLVQDGIYEYAFHVIKFHKKEKYSKIYDILTNTHYITWHMKRLPTLDKSSILVSFFFIIFICNEPHSNKFHPEFKLNLLRLFFMTLYARKNNEQAFFMRLTYWQYACL